MNIVIVLDDVICFTMIACCSVETHTYSVHIFSKEKVGEREVSVQDAIGVKIQQPAHNLTHVMPR